MSLRSYGYEVEVATNGPSALQAVQAAQPDVALLNLPMLERFELGQQIRQQPGGKKPLLIGSSEEERQEPWHGINPCLVKPVDLAELLELLKRVRRITLKEALGLHEACEKRKVKLLKIKNTLTGLRAGKEMIQLLNRDKEVKEVLDRIDQELMEIINEE
jgi:CheY-like chemotaxis protein